LQSCPACSAHIRIPIHTPVTTGRHATGRVGWTAGPVYQEIYLRSYRGLSPLVRRFLIFRTGCRLSVRRLTRELCGRIRPARSARLRLRAQLCFDRGNVFQYWRTKLEQACVGCFAPQISGWNNSDGEPPALEFARSTVPGVGRGKQELAAGTLTPSILVRIQVPQPGILLKSLRICSFLARRNSLETSAR
jgi:hypothetical protein